MLHRLPVRARSPFRPLSTAVLAAACCAAPLSAANGGTQRASVSNAGVEGNGLSYYGGGPSDRCISGDGRYVVFRSEANNLVPGDTNNQFDVFLRDTVANTIERISVSSGGLEGNGASDLPSISADGRYVAFESDATNLVAGDINGLRDVFVRDRLLGTTELVSLSSAGQQGDCSSARPSISADGRFVAFQSCATNWIAGKTVALIDIFVRDRWLGTTEWINPPLSGSQNNHHSFDASISDDGRYVAFDSLAGNLAPAAFNTQYSSQVYLRDRLAAATTWISVCTLVPGESSNSFRPSVSGDGSLVAYESDSSTAVPGDTNGTRDIFVRDHQAGTTERVNVSSSGEQAVTTGPSVSTGSGHPSLSRTGRYVAFASYANNLVAGDSLPFNFQDIFRRDRVTGTTTLESVGAAGNQGNSDSNNPSISPDGEAIVFVSFANDLVPGDTNFTSDAFVRRAPADAPRTYCTAGTSSNGCQASMAAVGSPSASAAGGYAVTCQSVEGSVTGLFFYGVTGGATVPWGAGSSSFLCFASPTQRAVGQFSGGTASQCDGALAFDLSAYLAANPGSLGQPFLAGQQIWLQAWYRDPPAPKGSNLSDGLELTFAP